MTGVITEGGAMSLARYDICHLIVRPASDIVVAWERRKMKFNDRPK